MNTEGAIFVFQEGENEQNENDGNVNEFGTEDVASITGGGEDIMNTDGAIFVFQEGENGQNGNYGNENEFGTEDVASITQPPPESGVKHDVTLLKGAGREKIKTTPVKKKIDTDLKNKRDSIQVRRCVFADRNKSLGTFQSEVMYFAPDYVDGSVLVCERPTESTNGFSGKFVVQKCGTFSPEIVVLPEGTKEQNIKQLTLAVADPLDPQNKKKKKVASPLSSISLQKAKLNARLISIYSRMSKAATSTQTSFLLVFQVREKDGPTVRYMEFGDGFENGRMSLSTVKNSFKISPIVLAKVLKAEAMEKSFLKSPNEKKKSKTASQSKDLFVTVKSRAQLFNNLETDSSVKFHEDNADQLNSISQHCPGASKPDAIISTSGTTLHRIVSPVIQEDLATNIPVNLPRGLSVTSLPAGTSVVTKVSVPVSVGRLSRPPPTRSSPTDTSVSVQTIAVGNVSGPPPVARKSRSVAVPATKSGVIPQVKTNMSLSKTTTPGVATMSQLTPAVNTMPANVCAGSPIIAASRYSPTVTTITSVETAPAVTSKAAVTTVSDLSLSVSTTPAIVANSEDMIVTNTNTRVRVLHAVTSISDSSTTGAALEVTSMPGGLPAVTTMSEDVSNVKSASLSLSKSHTEMMLVMDPKTTVPPTVCSDTVGSPKGPVLDIAQPAPVVQPTFSMFQSDSEEELKTPEKEDRKLNPKFKQAPKKSTFSAKRKLVTPKTPLVKSKMTKLTQKNDLKRTPNSRNIPNAGRRKGGLFNSSVNHKIKKATKSKVETVVQNKPFIDDEEEEDVDEEEFDEGNKSMKLPKPMRTAKVFTDVEIQNMISDS